MSTVVGYTAPWASELLREQVRLGDESTVTVKTSAGDIVVQGRVVRREYTSPVEWERMVAGKTQLPPGMCCREWTVTEALSDRASSELRGGLTAQLRSLRASLSTSRTPLAVRPVRRAEAV
jgi:hypothetical protein